MYVFVPCPDCPSHLDMDTLSQNSYKCFYGVSLTAVIVRLTSLGMDKMLKVSTLLSSPDGHSQ